jgi:protein-disulfide isomerase
MIRSYRYLAAVFSCLLTFTALLNIWSCKPTAPSSAAVRPDPAGDARLKDFLQKHFRIADPSNIQLGTANPSSIEGIWARTVSISSELGSAQLTIYSDPEQQKFIIGQLLDVTQDPWGRVDVRLLHLDDRPSIGPSQAPITMVEFADFECPHCARSMNALETAVRSTYKDKVRLIYKYYPLAGHLWARNAAIAAECVRLQNPDAFWEFARDLYRDQSSIDPGNLRQHVEDYAGGLKLDLNALSACMLGRAADDRITQDQQDGAAIHISSTPVLLVDSIPVIGAVDEKTIAFVMDSELQSRQASR